MVGALRAVASMQVAVMRPVLHFATHTGSCCTVVCPETPPSRDRIAAGCSVEEDVTIAAKDAGRARRQPLRVNDRSAGMIVVPASAPLPHISVHIVQPPRIRWLPTYPVRYVATVPAPPQVRIQQRAVVTVVTARQCVPKRLPRRRSRPTRILPLRLRRQSILIPGGHRCLPKLAAGARLCPQGQPQRVGCDWCCAHSRAPWEAGAAGRQPGDALRPQVCWF